MTPEPAKDRPEKENIEHSALNADVKLCPNWTKYSRMPRVGVGKGLLKTSEIHTSIQTFTDPTTSELRISIPRRPSELILTDRWLQSSE